MAGEKKKEVKKEVKKYWTRTAPSWSTPILKLKDETSDRYLTAIKEKINSGQF